MSIKSITLTNGKEIQLWEDCKDCGGEGGFQNSPDPEDCYLCPTCSGYGQAPIRYTTEQYIMAGGIMTDDTPVWYCGVYQEPKLVRYGDEKRSRFGFFILGFCQKPPADWSQE